MYHSACVVDKSAFHFQETTQVTRLEPTLALTFMREQFLDRQFRSSQLDACCRRCMCSLMCRCRSSRCAGLSGRHVELRGECSAWEGGVGGWVGGFVH